MYFQNAKESKTSLKRVAVTDGETKEFDVDQIPDENVIDTNGAGDAFVGGLFLRYLCIKQLTNLMYNIYYMI